MLAIQALVSILTTSIVSNKRVHHTQLADEAVIQFL